MGSLVPSSAHLDALAPTPPAPAGVTAMPFAETGPEPVYLVDAESVLEEPAEFPNDPACVRGRGLAKLAKSVAPHRARDAGLTRAYTSNDEVNAPMLAVNGWLGYRPVGAEVSCVKQFWRVFVRGADPPTAGQWRYGTHTVSGTGVRRAG
jgi:hypothetical protein